jgi:hypothetical protein
LSRALDQFANALRAGTPAFALALDDTDDACLINNRVRGRITLFGESDEFPDSHHRSAETPECRPQGGGR